MKHTIKTSIIGSYPIKIDNLDIMNSYFKQSDYLWNSFIKSSVDDMIAAGIDILSDGQTRDPMVQIFTRKLKGCRIRDRTEIVDKIKFSEPITVDDQKYVRSLIPKDKQLIGILTGPYTLTKSCVDKFYYGESQIAFDFAKALRFEAKHLQKYVDMISIDEPFFSNMLPDYGKDLIKEIIRDVTCPTRLHVCGDVSKIIPELLEMPVDILSHEFKASPNLFNEFKKYEVCKDICLGSVRSDDKRVESVDEIILHIKKGQDVFGDKIVQIAPDCGQRFLPIDVAFNKLKNLVLAGEKING